MKHRIRNTVFLAFASWAAISGTACSRQDDWLSGKPNVRDVVPETAADFQAILDNTDIFNYHRNVGLVGTDNVYVPEADVNTLSEFEQNLYLWKESVWLDGSSLDWNTYYRTIAQANIVLAGLEKIGGNGIVADNIKGQALFHRSFAYYRLAQLFCKPFNMETIETDLGLPLRTDPDVTALEGRSSLAELYDQVISDAAEAFELLPEHTLYVRPGKYAAGALLAKIYFIRQEYAKALTWAERVIKSRPELVDYNNPDQVSTGITYGFLPLGKNNPEILYWAEGTGFSSAQNYSGNVGLVPQALYDSYDADDLRKEIFFTPAPGGHNFLGSYSGNFYPFYGIATNEVYLIRAECRARSNDATGAMTDLNAVLEKRYKTGTYIPRSAADAEAALSEVLTERRKELILSTDSRWEDLRRLNTDPRFQTTISRTVGGVTYTLPPNSKRYILPIPEREIQFGGLQQNER